MDLLTVDTSKCLHCGICVECCPSCILTLGNIGIGLGGIGMDFSFSIYPDWALWVFSFLMLVGRLELFTVYALFSKEFWKRG